MVGQTPGGPRFESSHGYRLFAFDTNDRQPDPSPSRAKTGLWDTDSVGESSEGYVTGS